MSDCTADRHGTLSAYQRAKCRCPEAREEWRLYKKRRNHGAIRSGKISPLASRRKLQALARMGWTGREVSRAAGLRLTTVEQICAGRTPGQQIWLKTHDAVDAIYRRLQNTPGPSRAGAIRARNKGWAPPAAWDDIDDPAATPQGVQVKTNRRPAPFEDVEFLLKAGESGLQVAKRLGVELETLESRAHRHGRPEIARMLLAS